MAQRRVIEIFDDLTGEVADDAQPVLFGFEGKNYSIDLGAKNAEIFTELLAPYLKVATPLRRGVRNQRRQPAKLSDNGSDVKTIRAWAREKGYEVSDRGSLRTDIVEAFNADH